jgi:Flp pilus assembly protein TadG
MQHAWLWKLRISLRQRLRRMAADTRGVAAIEFAMLMPIMLVVFFGTIQVSTAVAVDRKVSLTARTLSDLISQAQGVTDTDFSNAFNTTLAMMSPYSRTPLQAKISQVYIDPTSLVGKVVWSKASNTTARNYKDVVTVPSQLQVAGTYLILSEISYLYQPIVGYSASTHFTSASYTLTDQMFTRPRQAACVTYSTWTTCPTTGSLP